MLCDNRSRYKFVAVCFVCGVCTLRCPTSHISLGRDLFGSQRWRLIFVCIHDFPLQEWFSKRTLCYVIRALPVLFNVVSFGTKSNHSPLNGWHYYYYYYYYYYYFILYGYLLPQAFSSWYFSWTSGDPHRSGFKLHTAVLSVLCVMFQVYYYYYTIWISLVTGLFFPVLLLKQRWSPLLRLQASHCSSFRVCVVLQVYYYYN